MTRPRATVAALLATAGCFNPIPSPSPKDAAVSFDGGTKDAALAPDAAVFDAGFRDAGSRDAASFDANDVADTGMEDSGQRIPRFVGSWGGRGLEPGQFIEPSSVELDSTGVVIVAGHEDRIQRFTQDGALIDIFGTPGQGDGQFNHPHGLAVDRARGDLVYVGDQNNHRLQVFTSEGVFVRQWGDAQFRHIHDVGIDRSTGEIFVGDYELHIVRKFSATGDLLGSYGGRGTGPGQFNGVWGISTDSAGDVYVADTFNRRVQKLDREGNYLLEWSGFDGVAFTKPTGVFVDTNDVVYVCDSLGQKVGLFDTAGGLVQIWDLAEILPSLTEPEDIVIDGEGRHIYIAEVFNHRVMHLVLDP